ncbi:unnamed protein product [Rotaria sp. Silwood1]|nr:unnamed protein product [Rotaria sp. Silwood1]
MLMKFVKKNYQKNHPHIAISLNNIGLIYKDESNFDEALNYCQKALHIDEIKLSSISKKNQIRKVYLEKMFTIEGIYFFIEFCSCMTYLKVNIINNMDIELFVRFILTKIIEKSSNQLSLLSFHVANY